MLGFLCTPMRLPHVSFGVPSCNALRPGIGGEGCPSRTCGVFDPSGQVGWGSLLELSSARAGTHTHMRGTWATHRRTDQSCQSGIEDLRALVECLSSLRFEDVFVPARSGMCFEQPPSRASGAVWKRPHTSRPVSRICAQCAQPRNRLGGT